MYTFSRIFPQRNYFERVLYIRKSFIAKRVISISVNLRCLRLKLLKYKENKKVRDDLILDSKV